MRSAPEAFPSGIDLDRSTIDRQDLYSKRRLFHQCAEAPLGDQQVVATAEAQREAHGNDHGEEAKRTQVNEVDDLRANQSAFDARKQSKPPYSTPSSCWCRIFPGANSPGIEPWNRRERPAQP